MLIPALAAGIFFSCEKPSPPPAPVVAAVPSYTIRAVIESLPSPDGRQFLNLHHEAIPTFADKDGKVVGMKEMVMPFPGLAPGVSLEGFAVGDAVEVAFEVRWNEVPRTVVTSIRRLPADVKPEFGAKKEPGTQ